MEFFALDPIGFVRALIGALAWVFLFWMLAVIFIGDIRKHRPRGLYFLYFASLAAILLHLVLFPLILIHPYVTDYDYLFFEYELIGGVLILTIVLAGWHKTISGGLASAAILFCLDNRDVMLERIAAPWFDPEYGKRSCLSMLGLPSYPRLQLWIFIALLLWLTYRFAYKQKPRPA